MKSKILRSLLVALLISTALPASAAVPNCAGLSRNLKLGMSGTDVVLLQQLLNKQTATRVSESGIGSAGNESSYFGQKTKLAVERFQELYTNEVLKPAGLTKGSGYVGALSRAKLAALCSAAATPAPVSAPIPVSPAPPPIPMAEVPSSTPQFLLDITTPVVATSSNTLKPYLKFPANYAVPRGGKITLFGGGFAPSNTVHVGELSWNNIVETAKHTLEVPVALSAQKGKFDVWFENSKGTTSKRWVIITEQNATPPKVTSFTPHDGLMGTEITITGENFSQEWNQIVVGTGIAEAKVSADSKQLKFTVSLPIPGVNTGQDFSGVVASLPIWFYVINPNGVSGPSVFTLKI